MTKKIIVMVLVLCALSGCSRKRLPKFSVTTTDDKLLYVDRVSVNPGFSPLGTRFRVSTSQGVSWIEKDLTGVKGIFFLHGGDQHEGAVNTMITYADKSSDFARCDPASLLICESIRGREEIPFTKIADISRNQVR